MEKHLIDFENAIWIEAGKGFKYKVFRRGIQQIRLVEFSEGFIEKDWCTKGHVGYVLEGSCLTDFNGEIEKFDAGDFIFISNEEKDRHKMIINKGGRVLLMLFEIV